MMLFRHGQQYTFKRRIKLLFLKLSTNLLLFGSVAAVIVIVGMFIWYSRDLPAPDKVKRKQGYSTTILDRNNKPLYDIFTDQNRKPAQLGRIPDTLKKATIAIEDKDFYKHQGFDPKGMVRSVFNILTLRGLQGGSTLTQQLVKNVLLTSERTLPRKIKEFVLAIQLESKYSKDEILQMYLNEAPYGGTLWGAESASQAYFGKDVKDLTLAESAILAGLPQQPSYYSPFGQDPKAYIQRTEEVLRRMREDGYITSLQETETKRTLSDVKFLSPNAQYKAPHFIEFIKKQLAEQFNDKITEGAGYQIVTTLDADLQEKAETDVKEEIDKLKGLKVSNGAAIAINPQTGEILAYVGSKQYNSEDPDFQGKFDVVSMGLRQPGSALKPITYAVGFSKGFTSSSSLMDVETHFPSGSTEKPDYIPKNYDGKFRGPVQIRYALANSINVPAVKMTALVGIKDILKTAFDMGLSTLAPTDDNTKRFGLSLTLGGGEVKLIDLTGAFGVFATGGVRNETYAIEKIMDTNGKVIYEHKKVSGRRVLPEDVSYLISNILSDNSARKDVFGLNSYLNIAGKSVAVKTGTTDDKRDNWTVGYTPSVAVGVWVGNNDNSAMDPKLASGVTGAAPIWNRLMKDAIADKKNEDFKRPDSIIDMDVDAFGGDGLPHEGKPTRKEIFIKGTEPKSQSIIYKKLKLSKKDNGKLANAVEIAGGSYDEKDFYVFTEDDPISTDGKNRWQDGINAWASQQPDSMYKPPTETSSSNENEVVVRIKKPSDKQQTEGNDVDVEADAKAVHDIKKMELYVDDSQKTSVDNNFLTEKLNLSTGIHKIKVKAYDDKGNSGEREITIGVKVSADQPTNTPVPPPSNTPVPPTPTP